MVHPQGCLRESKRKWLLYRSANAILSNVQNLEITSEFSLEFKTITNFSHYINSELRIRKSGKAYPNI